MKDFARFIAPLTRRIHMMLARGVVRLINDAGGLQKVQVGLLENETRDGLERFQEYGFSSNPLPGAVALATFISGNRDHGIVVAVDDPRHRKKGLQAGEVALYCFAENFILLKDDGSIEIQAPEKLRIVTPRLECTGDIIDRCEENPRTLHDMRTLYNAHVHVENDDGGPTDPPTEAI